LAEAPDIFVKNCILLEHAFEAFLRDLKNAGPLEWIAVISGIASVWFSRMENILVYPIGLLNTTIYIYLSLKNHLFGEAGVNFYYTVMSIYGWVIWAKRDVHHQHVVLITNSSRRNWIQQFLFFVFFYVSIYLANVLLKKQFSGAIPWADAFAAATAFTGMWLMARKKVESWYWWIATNIASIPLYAVKGLALTSVYYFILLVFAFWGLAEWKKRAQRNIGQSVGIG
jgi:nicotinamide mononucleotide transporter